MSIKGLFDDKHKTKMATLKYPHCYVGIPRKVGGGLANYGYYKKTDPDKYANYGSYGSSTMIHNVTNFTADQSDTFLIEDSWHKLTGVDDPNTTMRLWDFAGNKMDPYDYIIDIFYKLIIPKYRTINDNNPGEGLLSMYKLNRVDGWGDKYYATTTEYLASILGGVATMKVTDQSSSAYDYRCVVFGRHPSDSAMDLPSDSALGYDPDFTEGTVLDNLTGNDYWDAYFQRPHFPYEGNNGNKFLGTSEDYGNSVSSMLNNVTYTSGGANYSVDPSAAACGIPFSIRSGWEDQDKKFYMPELFKGFAMINNLRDVGLSGGTLPNIGALYMCLGVHQK